MLKKYSSLPACLAVTITLLQASTAWAQTLTQQFNWALENDPNYAAALKRHEATKELNDIANAAFLPALSGNASTVRDLTTDTSKSSHSVTLGINLTMQSIYAKDSVTAQIQQSESGLQATKQKLMADTVKNYFNVVKQQVQIKSIQAQIRSAGQNLAKIRKQRDLGLATPLQSANVENNVQQLYLSLLQTQQSLQVARNTLSLSTGKVVANNLPGIGNDVGLPTLTSMELSYWWQLADDNNFTLQAKKQGAEKFYHDYRQTLSKHYPTGRIAATHNSNTNDNVTFSISANLFDGGIVSSQAQQSLLNWRAEQDILRATINETKQKLDNLLLTLANNATQLKLLRSLLSSSKSSLAATQKEYQLGTKDLVKVLEARQAVATNQVNLTKARYDRLISQISLKQLAGSLAKADLTQLDQLIN